MKDLHLKTLPLLCIPVLLNFCPVASIQSIHLMKRKHFTNMVVQQRLFKSLTIKKYSLTKKNPNICHVLVFRNWQMASLILLDTVYSYQLHYKHIDCQRTL